DMMHIVVQVHEEIATGHQCVRWFIPANLVPLVTYEITVDSNSLETAENISLTMETSDPIRLLYEVGVDSEINDINMKDIVGNAHHNHAVVDSSNNVVGYAFYSNRWGEGHTLDGSGNTDKLDPTDHLATVSHFNPSKENERYYYVEDSLIYQESGGVYTLYKGDTAPSGNNFYRAYSVISKAGGNTGIEKEYVQISSAVLAETSDTLKIKRIDDADSANNGAWYVPAGQIYQQLTRERLLKNDGRSTGADKNGTDPEAGGNRTGTLDYYDYPVVERKGSGTQYSIYTFLGNNGRLVKYLTHGLKLTKTIDDASIAAGTEEFTFTVEFSNASGVKLSDANGNDITETATISGKFAVSGNTVTVKIKNGETVYLTGIAAGTEYTVKEIYDTESGYVVRSATSSETADGYGVSGTGKNTVVKGKIDQYVIDTAEFINTETSHAGNLVVSKTITHPYGDNYDIPVKANTVFKVDVNLTGSADVASTEFGATGTVKYKISETEYATGNVINVTTDANGNVVAVELSDNTVLKNTSTETTWWLGHDDSFTILELPEDVDYTVTEVLTGHNGFAQDAENSKNLAGTILSDETVSAEIVNKYTPAPATSAG
ncbi:MAG: hypothetical protein J6C04_06430, partial [Oscillospiraceae bacterium]|nr:hypothetical protein [Oscillospiraceae bacterium]